LKALIQAKQQGKTLVAEKQPRRAPVIDMMEALKRSLANTAAQKGKKPARARQGSEREHRRRLAG
jgi:non-homologous end joining protein Ku